MQFAKTRPESSLQGPLLNRSVHHLWWSSRARSSVALSRRATTSSVLHRDMTHREQQKPAKADTSWSMLERGDLGEAESVGCVDRPRLALALGSDTKPAMSEPI